jgi:hypothetical protein
VRQRSFLRSSRVLRSSRARPNPGPNGAPRTARGPAHVPEIAAVERISGVSALPPAEGAAFQRLGAEALARLRARYAEVMARIAERQGDDAEKDELKGRAERLNPDSWVTDGDVDAGLEQYEAVYERIRAVVGHARKRRDRS